MNPLEGEMDFFEVVKARRSVRSFTEDPVKEEDILKIIDAARRAPSAENEQPWHFIVLRDREFKKQAREMVMAMMDALLAQVEEERRGRIERMRYFARHFGEAPVAIAVLTKPWPQDRPLAQRPPFDPGLQSVAAATTILVLAATALGYGTCWATAPVDFARGELEALLGVEKPWSLVAMISLGRPSHPPGVRPRKPVEEIVTFIG